MEANTSLGVLAGSLEAGQKETRVSTWLAGQNSANKIGY
jgi:hypothetical protein